MCGFKAIPPGDSALKKQEKFFTSISLIIISFCKKSDNSVTAYYIIRLVSGKIDNLCLYWQNVIIFLTIIGAICYLVNTKFI